MKIHRIKEHVIKGYIKQISFCICKLEAVSFILVVFHISIVCDIIGRLYKQTCIILQERERQRNLKVHEKTTYATQVNCRTAQMIRPADSDDDEEDEDMDKAVAVKDDPQFTIAVTRGMTVHFTITVKCGMTVHFTITVTRGMTVHFTITVTCGMTVHFTITVTRGMTVHFTITVTCVMTVHFTITVT